ncbi:MAG: carbohydrate-binding protein [Firmicutes bacterium]|nr:carbohydrate-binding protein [Bacillota bacterium]
MIADDRVWVRPVPAVKNQKAEMGYKGLLANSGADAVWAHVGFDGWKNIHTIPMMKRGDGSFTCDITCQGDRQMNFCFKDSANHWDNNSGWNWSCDIKSNHS